MLCSWMWLTFVSFHSLGLYFQNRQTIRLSNKDFSGFREKGELLCLCVSFKGLEKGEIKVGSSQSIIFIPLLHELSRKFCFFLSSQKSEACCAEELYSHDCNVCSMPMWLKLKFFLKIVLVVLFSLTKLSQCLLRCQHGAPGEPRCRDFLLVDVTGRCG